MQNASFLLEEFRKKLDELKMKSYRISEEYIAAKDRVEHHQVLSKIMKKPLDPGVLSSLPNLKKYIREITAVETEIINLRNKYQKEIKKEMKNGS